MEPIGRPETSVRDYHYTLRNKGADSIYFAAETWTYAVK